MTDRSDVKLAAIFRRGGQKEELLGDGPSSDKQELNQQLQQLAVAWAIPKARRGLAAAVWRPLLGAFEVTVRGRQQFKGQGFMHNKKLYLNIEEAVFMMDQAELMLLVEQQEGQQQRLLSMQEALHMMVSLGVSLDRLQLLSHLNRIGYHVRRHPACQQQQQQHEEAHKPQQRQPQQELCAGPQSSTGGDAEMVFDAIACQAGFSYS
ncbi:hypothetical protein OEZ86_006840 [Tetradesmus obliquus]|nr:hypothetical protein OEZ86_006840 [Tetradesmus obliquus]